MAYSIDDIRKMIDAMDDRIDDRDVVSSGTLLTESGEVVGYTLHHGWDPQKSFLCDKLWRAFNKDLLMFIKSQNYDEPELNKVLSEVQLGDAHWDWLGKSINYKSDEYNWFYLVAENKPQGACLIYHPKSSMIDGSNIFYINYLAAAPWNRKNPMTVRYLKGVSMPLLKYATDFARRELTNRYGFCLHALPSAKLFYSSLGMIEYSEASADELPYFEMPEEKAQALLLRA